MRILHVIPRLGKSSGVSTFVTGVVPELRKLGHNVDLCTLESPIEVSATYDVIHIHGLWSPFQHKASAYAQHHDIPIVWSTHGMTAPWSLHHKWWKKCLPWYLYQRPDLKRAALIHCTTDLEADWNHALGFTNTFVAPLGTMLPTSTMVGARVPSRPQRMLLYVGRIYPVKALDSAIRAVAIMKHPVKLRIVGPDQAGHQAELKKLANDLGVRDKIDFAGPKYDDELSAEYDNCDGLILVSHTENFGATVVDALAHARPVITSTKTPWKIVLGNSATQHSTLNSQLSASGRCGWWVDNSSESLSRTFDEFASTSTSDLNLLGQNGLALVTHSYTWPAIARNLIAQYGRIINHD